MPNIAIITGSAGLIGSESVRHFAAQGYQVVGIDNDMRREFFGESGSTSATAAALCRDVPKYRHVIRDIRDTTGMTDLFSEYGPDIKAVIHTAAQPSHDWAAHDPATDFGVNAVGTLSLLQATHRFAPKAAFVFTSTNKVYGDAPNRMQFEEAETRWIPVLPPKTRGRLGGDEPLLDFQGFDESMSIDQTTHSLFGASKAAADLLVQEFGRYFGMNTVCFRGGCLTGPAHAGVPQHGFLSYLVKCAVNQSLYTVIGYGGKQVRDNIHASDLVAAFSEYVKAPKPGEVYNIGGGPERSCSVIEAIGLVEEITGREMVWRLEEKPRVGDHKWWVTDTRKFEKDYPAWEQRYSLGETIEEIAEAAA